jgi:hypothetical protein
MNTSFYSLSEIIARPNTRTKTEVLWNALRIIEPELEDVSLLKNIPEELRDGFMEDFMLRGMYCLTIENKIVSVACIKGNVIDRIITLPLYRRKGYASILIKWITSVMKASGMPCVFSPVRQDVVPLFLKLGWVKCGTGAPDGTFDYCPAEDLSNYGVRHPEIDVQPWIQHLLFKQKHLFGNTIRT